MRKESILSAIGKISDKTGIFVGYWVLVMIAIIVVDVVLRFGLGKPTIWAGELCSNMFGIYFLIGGALTLRENAHVSIEIFYDHFGRKTRLIIDIVSFGFISLFCVILVWMGGQIAIESITNLERSHTQWAPPLYPLKSAIPLGGLLVWLQACANLVSKLWNK